MKSKYSLALFSAFVFLSGCASFKLAGDVQAGRQALILGNHEAALAHFQRAANSDPEFVMPFGVFREGVWTYVGRANYATGKMPEARRNFERALAVYQDDSLARLYLGLVLVQDGDRPRGLKEVESGMRGLYDWLEYITYNTRYGQFWDPRREIRSEIQNNLAMISRQEIDLQRLIAGGESVGTKMEVEIDLAYRDERTDIQSQNGSGGTEP